VDERQAMARALELAWRGWGRVAPNPMVGAVVLRDGETLGEGWHAEFGQRHAEPIALDMAGAGARGATLVVTLEPCAHQGKQPPCVDAVLAVGVRRVVVALADPNPRAQGGAARLREAGVEVECGLLAAEAAAQNAAFVAAHREPARPFVALKLATSLDGRIADRAGRSRWISGPDARDWVQWLRAGFDALAVGGGTVRADDPSLTVRGILQPRRAPLRVVLTRRAELPTTLVLVRTARDVPTLVFATDGAGPGAEALGKAGVEVAEARDLAGALGALRAREVGSVLVEGGGRLAGALLDAGLVDRLYWVQSPVWLGEDGVPAVAGHRSLPLAEAPRWRIVERRALGEDTLLVADRS
jgi:diaminohydroxyphosphoribosylaminopyrimidine deaminase/5-amino-6-(5-phosphoribosylamino)uracil reductase